MDIAKKFEDLGVGVVTGIQLMKSLNISPDDFVDEARFLRFKDIIDYFKDIPDREYIFNRITIGKNVDKLDHVWGYTELSKRRNDITNYLSSEEKRLNTLTELGDEKQQGEISFTQSSILEHRTELSRVNEQIGKYEA